MPPVSRSTELILGCLLAAVGVVMAGAEYIRWRYGWIERKETKPVGPRS